MGGGGRGVGSAMRSMRVTDAMKVPGAVIEHGRRGARCAAADFGSAVVGGRGVLNDTSCWVGRMGVADMRGWKATWSCLRQVGGRCEEDGGPLLSCSARRAWQAEADVHASSGGPSSHTSGRRGWGELGVDA